MMTCMDVVFFKCKLNDQEIFGPCTEWYSLEIFITAI